MGLLDSLWPRSSSSSKQEPTNSTPQQDSKQDFCSTEFEKVWSSFVHSLADFGFAGVPCATPDEAGVQGELPTQVPAAERLVALGDLHGDFGKTKRAFRLAGLTDHQDRWVGGDTVCVQVGDILDRGDNEVQICYFLERLQAQAQKAGGKLYVLNGNHETMNMMGNTRYATPGASAEIARWQQWQQFAENLKAHCRSCSGTSTSGSGLDGGSLPASPPPALAAQHGSPGSPHFSRVWALQPGSELGRRFFANHPTVLQVGSTVFVHGGVLPQHVSHGFENINRETRRWMLGQQAIPSSTAGSNDPASSSKPAAPSTATAPVIKAPNFLRGSTAIVWARDYSAEHEVHCDCDKLKGVLQSLPGASRMVMGHTIQGRGINAACEGRALRIDTGMSLGCGNGEVEVLELRKDGQQVWRLREGQSPVLLSSEGSSSQSEKGGGLMRFLPWTQARQVSVSG